MKTVTLDELKEQVLSAEHEALAIEHRGQLVGYFYPASSEAEVKAATERLHKATNEVMQETGWSEEELVQAMSNKRD
ncbi:MAG: hypothetical protein ACFB4I_09415, partial [Cyanophyceae cyanobacterium]